MLRDGNGGFKKVIIRAGRTDMRRGIDGLVSIIRLEYGIDPLEEGTLFLFCGRKRSSIKGIIFDGDGFIMLTKRLLNGSYQWPRNTDEAMSLSKEEFKRLMEGFTIHSSIQKYERIKENIL